MINFTLPWIISREKRNRHPITNLHRLSDTTLFASKNALTTAKFYVTCGGQSRFGMPITRKSNPYPAYRHQSLHNELAIYIISTWDKSPRKTKTHTLDFRNVKKKSGRVAIFLISLSIWWSKTQPSPCAIKSIALHDENSISIFQNYHVVRFFFFSWHHHFTRKPKYHGKINQLKYAPLGQLDWLGLIIFSLNQNGILVKPHWILGSYKCWRVLFFFSDKVKS